MEVTPTPFSEKLIVQYLLGQLPEEQCVRIEDEAFQNEQHLQTILDVESDLIDEYVRGEFSQRERSLFENHFLASPERRRKVEFARALAKVTAVEPAPQVVWTPAKVNPLLAFFRRLGPVPALSFAVMVVLLIAGAWLAWTSIRLRAERDHLQTQRRQLEEQLGQERERNQVLAEQLRQEKPQELPPNVPAPTPERESTPSPLTLAMTLLPGISRSSGSVPTLQVTPEVSAVRTGVVIDPQEAYQRFRVEVRAPNGAVVWSRSNLQARRSNGGRTIGLNLPAAVLKSGRHELVVQGSENGANTDIGYYYFEVRKTAETQR
jgi:hypothetical protein